MKIHLGPVTAAARAPFTVTVAAKTRRPVAAFTLLALFVCMPLSTHSARAQSPAVDCPMAFQPYSSNTVIFDLMLDPQTRPALERVMVSLPDAYRAVLLDSTLPSFGIITTPRLVAPLVKLPDAALEKLDSDLASIPVTSQAAAARCARYDQTPPVLPGDIKAPAILVFAKVPGYRHGEAIDAAAVTLKAMGERRGWTLVFSDNAAVFNPQMLKRFQAVVWSNVSGDVLTLTQQRAFRAYIEEGGGFAAFHGSGGDPFYPWAWYGEELIGAPFLGHPGKPQFQTAKVVIDDPNDAIVRDIVRDLGASWTMSDEWYSYKTSPRVNGAHILATLDESTYSPMAGDRDLRMGDHPIAWKRCVRAGRSFYTAIGHRPENFSEEHTVKLLERGIAWAAGLGETQCRDGKEVGVSAAPVSAAAIDATAGATTSVTTDAAQTIGDVTPKRLLRTGAEPGEWLTSGRDWRQTFYSPVSKIDKRNVGKLGFAWAYDIDSGGSFQATPLVVDGVMFTSGTYGDVYALDAATGTLRWSFKPKIEPNRFVFAVHRGVAVWRGKVYVPSADGYLYALDASSGKVVWTADTLTDRTRPFWITGAPYIAKDLVLVGNGGSEFGTRGYVTAYNTQTGREAWRFFVVPGDPKQSYEHPEVAMAAKTWDPQSVFGPGVGGNVWDSMSYDPELNLLYVGTGNGAPWNRKLRSPAGGDNLFLSSILAINPDTGRLVWYYQTTPGENWDWGATQKMTLADLKIAGRTRKVLLQAPKNGFFYVLDRATGELISAQPLVYINWASHVDMKTGRPVETGKGDYMQGPKLIFPMDKGGHNWHPMSFNPGTGLVYIPVIEAGAVYANQPGPFDYQVGRPNFGVYYRFGLEWEDGITLKCGPSLQTLRQGEPDPRARTFLRAWDPVKQKSVWEVKTTGSAGVISTAAGLVFQGDADGHFRVFDATSGALLQDVQIGGRMMAAPMSYVAHGEQYVAIMAGGPSKRTSSIKGRIVALKLGGGQVPVPTAASAEPVQTAPTSPPLPDSATPAQITLGNRLFEANCALCHARGSHAPDLAQMTREDHAEFFDIVLHGSRAAKGMNSFGAVLNESEAKAIQAYVLHQAWSQFKTIEFDSAKLSQGDEECSAPAH